MMMTAIRAWYLPATTACLPVEEGKDTICRLVLPDGGVLYLKRRTAHFSAARECALLTWLREAGLPTAPPLPTVDGAPAVRVGDEVLVLYPALPGEIMRRDALPGVDEHAFGYGIGCACLHRALARYPRADDFGHADVPADLSGWIAETIDAHAGELHAIVPATVRSVGDYLRAHRDLLPEQLIHRDLHLSNILTAEARVVGYLDFDLACVGLRLFDPCYTLTCMLAGGFEREDHRRHWPALVTRLFAGYLSVHPLLEGERKAVVAMMLAIQVLFVAHGYRLASPALAHSNARVIPWLWDHRQVIETAVDAAWTLAKMGPLHHQAS